MRTCAICEASVTGKGRSDARYCSSACRQKAYRLRRKTSRSLPAVMAGSDRWVAWKPFKRRGGWSKMPIQADGRPASSTDSGTWTSLKALDGWMRKGWVLGEGIGCVDLDDCIRDGKLEPWAREIIDEHADDAVWVEVSPSGRGVHVFLPMEPGKGRVIRDGRNVEVYPPDSGRFICVTGTPLRV